MKRPTQADIARALDVSPATVALVVGKSSSSLRERLSAETIRKIEAKAEELGYSPHRGAQMMRKGRSNLIVLLNFSNYSELTDHKVFEFGRLVHEAGFDFQIIDSFFWTDDARRLVEQIVSLRPEGVAIIGSVQNDFGPEHIERLLKFGIPLVSMGGRFPGVPLVRYDGRSSFRTLTEWALDRGRKRLIMVVNPENGLREQVRDRLDGFREAIASRTGQPPETLDGLSVSKLKKKNGLSAAILHHRRHRLLFDPFSQGMEAMEAIAHWQEPPDALLGINDFFAIGALTVCNRRGLRVPDDLMISGFDNLSYGTQGLVSLTSVEQPIKAMSEALMELLQEQMTGKTRRTSTPPERILPCEIFWRESTGARKPTQSPHPANPPEPSLLQAG
ncbi:MAG: LacI family DNA-binding transcriptional regulator [Chthoniobacterales bacterium]|nr:LacI family DNA-binding transcriptional regulator [Chthoniobacterales bacterium]